MAENLTIGKEYVLKFIGKERLTSVDFVDTFRVFDKDSKFAVMAFQLGEFVCFSKNNIFFLL